MSHSVVNVSLQTGFVHLNVVHPAVSQMTRLIVYNLDSGSLSVWNHALTLRPAFRGHDIAARSITVQARAAQGLRFARLTTYADGNVTTATAINPNKKVSGYYIWPRLGFNASIPADVVSKLPSGLQHAATLAELISVPEGERFWYEHGHGISVDFDLAIDSISWKTLMRYTSERLIGI